MSRLAEKVVDLPLTDDVEKAVDDVIRLSNGEATKPAFFVGLLDFLLANEDDLMDFAGSAGLDPSEVERARDALSLQA